MAVWSLREMLFLLRWARTYRRACGHVERRDWTARWEGREVVGSGSLIGGGRRADMRHLLLWPPIGAAAGVWRLWRCPLVLERSSKESVLERFSFLESCLLHCFVHSKRCTDRMQWTSTKWAHPSRSILLACLGNTWAPDLFRLPYKSFKWESVKQKR